VGRHRRTAPAPRPRSQRDEAEDLVDAAGAWLLIAGNDDVRLFVSRRPGRRPGSCETPTATCATSCTAAGACSRLTTDRWPTSRGLPVVPKGTTHRLVPEVMTASSSSSRAPGSSGCPTAGSWAATPSSTRGMLEVPEPDPHHEEGSFEVRVKRDGTFTSLFFRWHPLDVAGWQGDLCPVRLNILSHRPVTSPATTCRHRRTPPSSTTASRSVPSSPGRSRGSRRSAGALLPRQHRRRRGALLPTLATSSRGRGSARGFMTLHPRLHHGPQPAAIVASRTKQRTTRWR